MLTRVEVNLEFRHNESIYNKVKTSLSFDNCDCSFGD